MVTWSRHPRFRLFPSPAGFFSGPNFSEKTVPMAVPADDPPSNFWALTPPHGRSKAAPNTARLLQVKTTARVLWLLNV